MHLVEYNPGTEVVITIRCPCNFSCYYCVARRAKETVRLHSLDRIREIHESIGTFTVTGLECASGEPTLHPQSTGSNSYK
jgi:molybdenum cofactor biosynthesis enzyme MoaA